MKDLNKNEKVAEKYFKDHGFEYKMLKQYLSKTVYELSKDGLTYKWELPYGITEPKKYMELACGKNHELMVELEHLKNETSNLKPKMTYIVHHDDDLNNDGEEITYDKALDILLTTYRDNDMTRDMLTLPNRIMCRFSTVDVKDDSGLIPMAGLYNLLPNDIDYDDDGNRV